MGPYQWAEGPQGALGRGVTRPCVCFKTVILAAGREVDRSIEAGRAGGYGSRTPEAEDGAWAGASAASWLGTEEAQRGLWGGADRPQGPQTNLGPWEAWLGRGRAER